MYKKLLVAAVVAGSAGIQASAQVFEEGAKFLHVGVGFGSPYAYSGSKMGVPPVHASFEMGVSDKIGVGGLVGYTSSKWDYNSFGWSNQYNYNWNFSYLVIGARGAYHFVDDDKWDAYGGLMLGYNVASAKWETDDPNYNSALLVEPKVGGVAFGGFLGGRMALGESSALFAELGYNIAWISAGYCARF
ncbi:MAG: hypothetical protein KBH07_08085 [Flavobacteriales bacterium]|nr:hypothetical protein [Flavobacteriales bacterium]MBP9080360.1 hypothetical protein [Flavobacteriales bacterium]